MLSQSEQKPNILIVDNSSDKNNSLCDILTFKYNILLEKNCDKAFDTIRSMQDKLSLILLDVSQSVSDGFHLLNLVNKYRLVDKIPIIMISADSSEDVVEQAFALGVMDFFIRPFVPHIILQRISNTLMVFNKQNDLMDLIADQVYEKQKQQDLMINVLSHIVEVKNGESGIHVLHINTVTRILLATLVKKTDKYNLTARDIELISSASSLHDIGKMYIPESVLNKPSQLNEEEYAIMKLHTEYGAGVLKDMYAYHDEPLLNYAYEICRWHHERYDGRGYPDGLKGEEIPISAQVVSVADVYDALTSERVYKDAYSSEKAVKMILNKECGDFNPLLLECLVESIDTIKKEIDFKSISEQKNKETRRVIDELKHYTDKSVSTRTVLALNHEHKKNSFFTSISDGIQFEYFIDAAELIITEKKDDEICDRIIHDPIHNKRIMASWDREIFNKFVKILREVTPEDPIVSFKCLYGEKTKRWFRFDCCCLFSSEGVPICTSIIGRAKDIHAEHEKLIRLEEQSNRDSLTGFYNEQYAQYCIKRRIKDDSVRNYTMTLFDIDNFKGVNERYGHHVGNEFLSTLAGELSRQVGKDDILSRIGGNEFMLFVENVENVKDYIKNIFDSVDYLLEKWSVSLSIGISKSDKPFGEYDNLFWQAEQALYRCKRDPKQKYIFYNDNSNDNLSKEITENVSVV